MSPLMVSVIVPARNESKLIRQTIEHIRHAMADLKNVAAELIVVDNASTDGTWEILQVLESESIVRAVRLDELGAARARNHGRRTARGNMLVFVDADTWIPSNALSRIVEHGRSNKAAGITRLAGIDEDLRARLWWFFWEHVRRLPIPRAKAMPAVMFCTASAFDRYGPFDEEVAIGEEWPILANVYRLERERFVYDRSITALSSSRRMSSQRFGYSRTLFKYAWAIMHLSGRVHYTDRIR
jgi:glycosyltransferase involved in cell wall biosynthesis